jgi:hypothetical protein
MCTCVNSKAPRSYGSHDTSTVRNIKNHLPIIKGLHALAITQMRPGENWNMDRDNDGFRWVCAMPHVAHEVGGDGDLVLVEGGCRSNKDDAWDDLYRT